VIDVKVYQCPRCATAMEVDESAKPSTAPADGLPVWLIERGQPEGQEPTIWWRGKEQSGVPYMGLWTETAHDAMAFSSKATAEAFIASNYIRLRRATEHVFLNRADRLYARNFDLNREIVELRAKAQALQEQLNELQQFHAEVMAGCDIQKPHGLYRQCKVVIGPGQTENEIALAAAQGGGRDV
jgi:hypothetical protein